MCGGSKPKTPKVEPTPLPPVLVAPIEADPPPAPAGEEAQRRRRAASGRSDTVLTSGMGVTGEASTGGKKLRLGE